MTSSNNVKRLHHKSTYIANLPLKCLQLNLQHSRAATSNLTQLLTEIKIDIALLQEPYLFKNKPTGLPSKYRLYNYGKGKCRAAILVLNKAIDALIIHQISDEDAAAIEMRIGSLNFIAASMYFDIRQNIEIDMSKVKKIMDFAKGKGIGLLVAADSNSRSRLWYDVLSNKRGKDLEEFLIANQLYVMNEDNGLPTFQSSRGSSRVDLTLCNNTLVKEVLNWDSVIEESCSDHIIITFSIGSSAFKKDVNHQGIRFIVREEDFKRFDENFLQGARELLNSKASNLSQLDQELRNFVSDHPDPEEPTRTFQDIVTTTCKKSFKSRTPTMKVINSKSVPWWTTELTVMRKKVNAQRRRFQRSTDDAVRQIRKLQYHETKRQYQKAIRREKLKSWKEYCSITDNTNPWNAVYKLASGNIRKNCTLSTLKRRDGTYTTGLVDTMNYMFDHFTPEDDEKTDSEHHKNIRNKTLIPPNTDDDRPFTSVEIREIIENMNSKKAPGMDGVTSDILRHIFKIAPNYITALYNKCLETGQFPKQWKRAKIIPIVKPGKESSYEVTKYRPISLINVSAKVLEKLFINRIMHHLNSKDMLNKNQFGFQPQTSTVDAIMTVKEYIEESLRNKESVAMISLDVEGAFDSAWWPGILNALKDFQCPKNLYNLTKSYLSERRSTLTINSVELERNLTKGCPQGSCCGPGLWNIQYDSLLNLNYKTCTKVIAFADDVLVLVKGENTLEIENKANIEMHKISTWASKHKIVFNRNKTKVMLISRKKPRTPQNLNIYLTNGKIEQTDTIRYLGILIDKRFRFHQHIEHITEKSTKLIHALSKSAKINWGLRSDVMSIIYKGAILPVLSYGIPVWIQALNANHNVRRLKRVQRLINIKITKAFRTTSHEALCVIAGSTPIDIELSAIAKYYNIVRRSYNKEETTHLDIAKNYREWPHPAENIELQEKDDDERYTVQIYTDGSRTDTGVGSGIAVYISKERVHQFQYRLDNRCSNNQAEQLAILKALEKLHNWDNLTEKSAAVHTDSKITLDLLRNNPKHNSLIDGIKMELRNLQQRNWKIHFTWIKAHVGNEGNELADQLAKQAANNPKLEVIYNLTPTSAIKRELREESVSKWENEWLSARNGHITKSYFPSVQGRLKTKINLSHNFTAITTGHGKFGEYFHRFRIIDDPTCLCRTGSQTVDHIIWECELLESERSEFCRNIIKSGGHWPVEKSDLINKYLKFFLKFVNKINFDNLQSSL